jgi:glycosyltransferase involved in cell wall biosynthesis
VSHSHSTSGAAAGRPLRVVSIWHGAVRRLNRERYDALAQSDNLALTVVAPRRWAAALPREMEIEKGDDRGYRLIAASAWMRRHAAFHFYPRLFSILGNAQPDVVDVYEEPYSLITGLIAWWRNNFAPGSRVVFTACQNIAKRYPPPFRWVEGYVLASADAAMGLNQGAVDVFRAKGYDGPFEVVPTGIDPARLRRVDASELRARLGLTRPTVGYLGRLVEEKGVATLLEAAARGNGDFQLLIVGDGPQKEAVRRQAGELNLGGRTVWVEAVASDDIARHLSCMDVLVLPSQTRPHWKEQLGRVLIEAMACGVAVIGSRSGAIPDVVGDAGLLFPEGDAGQLREALDRLLGDEDCRRDLAARGRRRAETEFSWARIAAKTRDVWRQSLERPPLEVRRRLPQ